MRGREVLLEYLPQNVEMTIASKGITLWHKDPPLLPQSYSCHSVPLVKANEEIVTGFSLTIFVPHAVDALPNSHHTQQLLASCLTSYEIFLLTVPLL